MIVASSQVFFFIEKIVVFLLCNAVCTFELKVVFVTRLLAAKSWNKLFACAILLADCLTLLMYINRLTTVM